MKRRCLLCRTLITSGSYCSECRPYGRNAWRRLRSTALARDGGRCVECGAPASEVDHIVPVSLGGADDIANVRSLCHACHAGVHPRGRGPQR